MELSKVTSASQARVWPKHFTQVVESAPDKPGTEAKRLRLSLFLQRKSLIGFGFDIFSTASLHYVPERSGAIVGGASLSNSRTKQAWRSRKWCGWGHGLLRQRAKSVHQPYKAWTICLFYRRESQSQSTPRRNVPHYPFRPDLSFGDTKMNLGPRIDRSCLWSIEEHTPKAQVLDG